MRFRKLIAVYCEMFTKGLKRGVSKTHSFLFLHQLVHIITPGIVCLNRRKDGRIRFRIIISVNSCKTCLRTRDWSSEFTLKCSVFVSCDCVNPQAKSLEVQASGVLYLATVTSISRSSTVVKVLCYKSEGRWFDPSWCQWIFHWYKFLPIALWP